MGTFLNVTMITNEVYAEVRREVVQLTDYKYIYINSVNTEEPNYADRLQPKKAMWVVLVLSINQARTIKPIGR